MKSFKTYLTEARPKGQKRYQRDTSKLEYRLDKMYAAGGSQKKIDRAEMRLARRTGEGEFDIEDINLHTKKGQFDIPLENEDDPKTMSVEDIMRMHGMKLYTHGWNHAQIGAAIRSSAKDIMTFPVEIQPNVTDEELGREAHKMAFQRRELIKKYKSNKKANKKYISEKWSLKYKKSINCNNPKGFSQKAHCQGKRKNK